MKLSDFKDEAALDLLADIIDPAAEIMSDKGIAEHLRNGQTAKAIKPILKNHKQAITTILALLDGEDPGSYHFNFLALPKKLLELLNDPELMDLFQSQGQTVDNPNSGSATGSTEGDGQ